MTTFIVNRKPFMSTRQKHFAAAAPVTSPASKPLISTATKWKLGGLGALGAGGALATKAAIDGKNIIEGNMDQVQ